MQDTRMLRYVSGGLEAVLAIPVLGGMIILGLSWTPLAIMFILHCITLILCYKNKDVIAGSIVGIAASALGWIPFLGWSLHLISAILLFVLKSETNRHLEPEVSQVINSDHNEYKF